MLTLLGINLYLIIYHCTIEMNRPLAKILIPSH